MNQQVNDHSSDDNELLNEMFRFTAKWIHRIHPLDLADFLYGEEMINLCFDNNSEMLIQELHKQLDSGKKSIIDFRQFIEKFYLLK